jgi:hypothetical protein
MLGVVFDYRIKFGHCNHVGFARHDEDVRYSFSCRLRQLQHGGVRAANTFPESGGDGNARYVCCDSQHFTLPAGARDTSAV